MVWIGWVPVVSTPILTGNVGVEAAFLSAGITTNMSLEATLTGGVAFTDAGIRPIGDVSANFGFGPPSFSFGPTVKGYLGPGCKLFIYGVTGPYAILKSPYAELDVDLLATPWWELYGGIELNVGTKFEIFGKTYADYFSAVIGYRRLLAQAEANQGHISGIVRDALPQGPLDYVLVDVYNGSGRIGTGRTDSNGTYSLLVVSGSGYRVEFSKAGYLPAVYYNVSVGNNTTTHLEAVL